MEKKKWRISYRTQLILFGVFLVFVVAIPVLYVELRRPWDTLDQLIAKGKIVIVQVKSSVAPEDLQKLNDFAFHIDEVADPAQEDYLIWTFNIFLMEGNLLPEEDMKKILEENEYEGEFNYDKVKKAYDFWREQFSKSPEMVELFKKLKETLVNARESAHEAQFDFTDVYIMADNGDKLVFLLDSLEWYEGSYPGLEFDVVENDCEYFRGYLKNGPGFDTDPKHYLYHIFPKFSTDKWGTWFSVWLGVKNDGTYNNFSLDFDAGSVKKLMWKIGNFIFGISLVILLAIIVITSRLSDAIMKELEATNRELERLDEMKDSFLYMVSHDLRTPMTSIQGYTEYLLQKSGQIDKERQEKCLNIILKESDRLTRLINNLLDLQRFRAGKVTMDLTDVNIADTIAHSVESFQGAAIPKKITIEKDVPEGGLIVSGNADRLAQVVANLLSNAIKFTPEGGRIKATAALVSEGADKLVKVTVSDNGPGIPKEQQADIFQKFMQIKSSTRGKEEGSGLGLALVKEIIEYHGGKTGVQSEPGQGSSFYFTVPLKQKEDPEHEQQNTDR